MKKILSISQWRVGHFAFVTIFLGSLLLFIPKGLIHWGLSYKETNKYNKQIKAFEEQEQKLNAKIERFKKSPIVQQREIREKLGYLAPDEYSVEFNSNE